MAIELYILDFKGVPITATTPISWANWMGWSPETTVGHDYVHTSCTILIRTVFLGIDHDPNGDGAPVLWETIILGGKFDHTFRRCSGSREQAKAMHAAMIKLVEDSLPPKVTMNF